MANLDNFYPNYNPDYIPRNCQLHQFRNKMILETLFGDNRRAIYQSFQNLRGAQAARSILLREYVNFQTQQVLFMTPRDAAQHPGFVRV